MFALDSNTNEDPIEYGDAVCDSILLQIDALRRGRKLPPLVWTGHDNDTAKVAPLEED